MNSVTFDQDPEAIEQRIWTQLRLQPRFAHNDLIEEFIRRWSNTLAGKEMGHFEVARTFLETLQGLRPEFANGLDDSVYYAGFTLYVIVVHADGFVRNAVTDPRLATEINQLIMVNCSYLAIQELQTLKQAEES